MQNYLVFGVVMLEYEIRCTIAQFFDQFTIFVVANVLSLDIIRHIESA